MRKPQLPDQFANLEPFTGWALSTEQARNGKRLAASMAELHAFYDAFLTLGDAVAGYVNQYPIDALPPQARTLVDLGKAFMEVSPAVELFHHPDMPHAVAAHRFEIHTPAPGGARK